MKAKPLASRRIAAGQFKAKCLALLDDVAATRREVVVTKRGRPVAKLVPLGKPERGPIAHLIEFEGDLVSPVDVDGEADR